MLTLHAFFSHIVFHIFVALDIRTVIAILVTVVPRREIFSAHFALLCVLREQFCREIFVKRKHRAEKIIAIDVVLTYELYAHIIHQNTIIFHAITTLFSYELVNLTSLIII